MLAGPDLMISPLKFHPDTCCVFETLKSLLAGLLEFCVFVIKISRDHKEDFYNEVAQFNISHWRICSSVSDLERCYERTSGIPALSRMSACKLNHM